MITFLKAQASSLLATLVDFMVTILLKELLGVWYFIANVCGVVAGGLTNFYINKDWVFGGGEKTVKIQAGRYFLVWSGNLLLNASGVWLLTQFGPFEYIISKMIVSLVVGFTYNYFLQKNFVFK